jgi:aspartyl aminopeptidase
LAFLKTHYYGGIKKYHWLSRPLALHGVVCLENGDTVEIHIGEDHDDPVFTVLDVLPHLSRNAQGKKKVSEAFEAERMNILIGGIPLDAEKGKEKVKLAILQLLHEKYGLKEEDFISAELEAVPAGRARHVGLDRSLIGGYGHDDRCCVFAALEAVFAATEPEVGSLVLLVDKEEIGSEGSTGAQSQFLELLLAELLEKTGEQPEFLNVSKTLTASQAISGDVNGGYDPDYPEVHEKRNAAFLGKGITLTKYTGSGGKYSASDANAEYVAWIRRIWNQSRIVWQSAGMGKIDEGGGGTIAKFLAKRGMEIVDAGPALLAMHAPFEIMHKSDLYSTYLAYKAFLEAKAR